MLERHSGNPKTDKLIAASIQWARRILEKINGNATEDRGKGVSVLTSDTLDAIYLREEPDALRIVRPGLCGLCLESSWSSAS